MADQVEPAVADNASMATSGLTSSQAASLLGVSISTIRSWTERGILPSWRTPGGHRRFAMVDILDIREDDTVGPREADRVAAARAWQRAAMTLLETAADDLGPDSELAEPFRRAADALEGDGST